MYEKSTGCFIKITDQYIRIFREGLQLMTGVTYICNHCFDLTSSKMMTGREKAGSLSVHTDDALLLHGHTAREPGGGQKTFVLTEILITYE